MKFCNCLRSELMIDDTASSSQKHALAFLSTFHHCLKLLKQISSATTTLRTPYKLQPPGISSYFSRWSAPGLSNPTFEEAMQQKFKPAIHLLFESVRVG